MAITQIKLRVNSGHPTVPDCKNKYISKYQKPTFFAYSIYCYFDLSCFSNIIEQAPPPGAAEFGSPGSPGAPLFQDMCCHFQKYKAKVSMINGSKVTVLHAYELFLSPCNEFGGFSDIIIKS